MEFSGYMTIEGEVQGVIEGSSIRKAREKTIHRESIK